MPEMDGLEATRRLREKEASSGHHQAVVAMTALVMKGDRERCISSGMDGYLSKPIRAQELDELLNQYAGKQRVRSAIPSGTDPQECVCAAELLERLQDDRSFLGELVEMFRADYPIQIARGREAVAKQDAGGVQRVGHALKGALKNLAAPGAAELAQQLEEMGESGRTELADVKFDELETELVRVVEQLEALSLELVH